MKYTVSQGGTLIEAVDDGKEIQLCTSTVDKFLHGLDVAIRKLKENVCNDSITRHQTAPFLDAAHNENEFASRTK